MSLLSRVIFSGMIPHGYPYTTLSGENPDVFRWYDSVTPVVSIIILNHNRADLTKKCLDNVWLHTGGCKYEVIVVDNGSTGQEFSDLLCIDGPCTLIRLNENRFFGEGNNIGVDHSCAPFVVFLNNDAFVTDAWLPPLLELLSTEPRAGAVGPKILYPDGRLQEAGAYIDETGQPYQVGKTALFSDQQLKETRIVDYVSGACIAMPRSIFKDVGGFDLLFEPMYYEDVDMCLKIRLLGKYVYYCPHSTVFHMDGATSKPEADRINLPAIVTINRQNFVNRWGEWLKARVNDQEPSHPVSLGKQRNDERQGRDKIVFTTPYDLVPGGGERYLLSAAATLAKSFDVYVATKGKYSSLRLLHLGRELAMDLSGVRLISQSEALRLGEVQQWFVLGNQVAPNIPGPGKNNTYICQFPFPMKPDALASCWGNLETYSRLIVYSGFVENHLRLELAKARLPSLPIEVVYPPVRLLAADISNKSFQPPFKIVLIGRFFAQGHNKRHDVAIEAIQALVKRGLEVELHLIGSVPQGSRYLKHLEVLRRQAAGLPVTFHVNAPRTLIDKILSEAALYWHATGYEVDPNANAERCEHFGISILEGMSAGCIPFVCANGGPTEFITEGQDGFFYSTIEELVEKSQRVLHDLSLFCRISQQAGKQATLYSDEVFASRWEGLIAKWNSASGSPPK